MASIYDDDPVPPVWGPQAPHVAAALTRLREAPVTIRQGPYFRVLVETLEGFVVACRNLDLAEADYLRYSADFERLTFEGDRDSQAVFRAALVAYFNEGYTVLDAVAQVELGSAPKDPWGSWAGLLEEPSADPIRRTLARILTIRLRGARHVIAVHRKGWPAPAMILGGGTAALSRRPPSGPTPSAGLVAEVTAVMATLGIAVEDVAASMGLAAEQLVPRAAELTRPQRGLYSRLINQYGLQTAPVGAITPSLLALIRRATAT